VCRIKEKVSCIFLIAIMEMERWCILFDELCETEESRRPKCIVAINLSQKMQLLEKGLLWCVICLEVEL